MRAGWMINPMPRLIKGPPLPTAIVIIPGRGTLYVFLHVLGGGEAELDYPRGGEYKVSPPGPSWGHLGVTRGRSWVYEHVYVYVYDVFDVCGGGGKGLGAHGGVVVFSGVSVAGAQPWTEGGSPGGANT